MNNEQPKPARDSSDLVSLKYAAEVIGRKRPTFHRLYKRQLVPSPIIRKPINLWSARQLRLSRTAEIQQHPDTGIWYERDPDTLEWKPLPNQYVNTLPGAAA